MIVRRNPGGGRRRRTGMIVRRSVAPSVGERRAAAPQRARGVHIDEPGRRWPRPAFHPSNRLVFSATALAVVVALGLASFATLTSPMLSVRHVEVDGTVQLSAEQITQRSGLNGQNMFRADLAGAQAALLQLPLVGSVEIERSWPNTVRIHVRERQAWATWQQARVGYTIDRDGYVLAVEPAVDGRPVIHSSEPTSLRPGERVDYQAVDAAAQLYEQLPRQLGLTVAEVAFVAGKGVQVVTSTGQTALFGDSSGIAYKLAVWAALEKSARAEHISYTIIDLRYGNRPVLQ